MADGRALAAERTAHGGAEPTGATASQSHLRVLGLPPEATRAEIDEAHQRLVSDLTPGPGADHRNVALANELLAEVNQAYHCLRADSSVAS